MFWSNSVVNNPFVAPYTGPGDIVSGATAWWGLRAYTSASIGSNAVRLREDSGNTEQDFPTITGGGLNLTAISAFKGAANLFVTKVYDQVGVNHYIQATAGNQPKFTLSAIGSLPAMQDNGATTTLLQTTNVMTVTPQPYTFSTVYEVTNVADGMIAIQALSAFPQLRVNQGGANQFTLNDVTGGFTATANDNVWHALQGVFNGATSDANIDGVVNTGDIGGTTDLSAFKFDMFSFDGLSNFMRGYIGELGLWPSGFSAANSTAMSANQHTYWGF